MSTQPTTRRSAGRPSSERRCRIAATSRGFIYLYEKRDAGSWRTVEIRGRHEGWPLEEALNRARTAADLVGARVTVPLNLMQNASTR